MVAHTCNPITLEAETGGTVSLRPVQATQKGKEEKEEEASLDYIEDPVSENK